MKWIMFTGSEEPETRQRELDVRAAVRWVLLHGAGIVTGGSPGVDYYAITEALRFDPSGSRIKVILPTKLRSYIAWCRDRLNHSRHITPEIVDGLAAALLDLKVLNPKNFVELDESQTIRVSKEHITRQKELELAEEVFAFKTNRNNHVHEVIRHARRRGLRIELLAQH
jgi:hypothetical protein